MLRRYAAGVGWKGIRLPTLQKARLAHPEDDVVIGADVELRLLVAILAVVRFGVLLLQLLQLCAAIVHALLAIVLLPVTLRDRFVEAALVAGLM